jgi:arylsulfatase A-like enzyme
MSEKKPNILFLMTDQMQGRVLEREHPCLTPNLDWLAAAGMRFTRAYTPNAVCSPARASLMTGLLPHNHGVLHVVHNTDSDQSVLRKDKPHWAQKLVSAGYRTGFFGKWHVERSHRLEQYGWQVHGEAGSELFKAARRRVVRDTDDSKQLSLAKYLDAPEGYSRELLYGVTDIPAERRDMGIVTTLAEDFLAEAMDADAPWCCFVSLKEPHDPFVCGADAYALYDPEALVLPPNADDDLRDKPGLYRKAGRTWAALSKRERKEAMACYYASITEIDRQFGRLIGLLQDRNLLANTIVVVTSDHGELLGAHGLYTKNISAMEEVYNIPSIVAAPGMAQGLTTDARVGLHDVGPTLLELAGCAPLGAPDSRSFAAVLRDPVQAAAFRTGFAEYHGGRVWLTQRIVWDGDWKYVFNGFDADELYNLRDDPFEMTNLVDQPELDGVVRSLCAKMWDTIRRTNDRSLYNSNYPSLRLASYGPTVQAVGTTSF